MSTKKTKSQPLASPPQARLRILLILDRQYMRREEEVESVKQLAHLLPAATERKATARAQKAWREVRKKLDALEKDLTELEQFRARQKVASGRSS